MGLIIKQTPPCTLIQGDAVEMLGRIESGSVDMIVTDPAYESLEKHRKRGTTTRLKHSKGSSNDWFQIFPNVRFPELFAGMYRVLKKNSHLYMHTDCETMLVVLPMAKAAGFRFWKPLVWDKKHIGMGYHYRSRYEFILFFEKGKRKLHNLGTPDILEVARIAKGYPTQKPKAVEEVLISQSSNEGDLVLDPFMGCGTTGHAAFSLNRQFLGIDISSSAMVAARERLGGLPWNKSSEKLESSETSANCKPETC